MKLNLYWKKFHKILNTRTYLGRRERSFHFDFAKLAETASKQKPTKRNNFI